MKEDTLIVTSGRNPEEQHGFVNPPVYHASTILHETVESAKAARERRWEPGTYTYGRHGTPTHEALEESVAALEGGWRSMAMGSGLAAIHAALRKTLRQVSRLQKTLDRAGQFLCVAHYFGVWIIPIGGVESHNMRQHQSDRCAMG